VIKRASKVAHDQPKPFHSLAQPTANSPELIFHIIKCREQASVLLSVEVITVNMDIMDNILYFVASFSPYTLAYKIPVPVL
jgi:hypothetical protein